MCFAIKMYSIQLMSVLLCCSLISTGALVQNYKNNLKLWMNEFWCIKKKFKGLEIWSIPRINWNQRKKSLWKCSEPENAAIVCLWTTHIWRNRIQTKLKWTAYGSFVSGRIGYLPNCCARIWCRNWVCWHSATI